MCDSRSANTSACTASCSPCTTSNETASRSCASAAAVIRSFTKRDSFRSVCSRGDGGDASRRPAAPCVRAHSDSRSSAVSCSEGMPPGYTCGGRSDRAATLLPVRRTPDSADAMLVFANVLWSLNYATTKLAFRGWNPLAFALSRFMVAGLIFSAYVWWREGSLAIHRRDIPLLLAASAVGICLNQLTFNYAVDNTTAGNVALILASAPAFAALFASAMRHEHVRPRHYAALGVSALGVGIVIQGG